MNRKSNRITIAALGLGVMMFAGSGIALAAPQPNDNEVVHYNDLNLGTRAGVDELAHRIKDAAWQVCTDVSPLRGTAPSDMANTRCQEEVAKTAVDSINNPALDEMFPAAPPAGDDLMSD